MAIVGFWLPLTTTAGSCVDATPEWSEMETRQVNLVDDAGESLTFRARIADSGRERAAGFQHLCASVIERTPIVFLFEGPTRPAFHMRNVHAPLDIAFVGTEGRIAEIQRMQPYVLGAAKRRVYQPHAPVRAAIEARPGFFAEQGVVAGAWLLVFPD